MAERYGVRRPGRRYATILAVAVLALGGLGWLGWAAVQHAAPDVRGELQGFDVVSVHEVTVVVDVRRPSGDAVRCVVTAQAADFATVGEASVTIPPGQSTSLRHELSIRTEREATSATVESCRTAS